MTDTYITQEISESDIYVEVTRGIGRNTVIGQYLDIDQSQLPKISCPRFYINIALRIFLC